MTSSPLLSTLDGFGRPVPDVLTAVGAVIWRTTFLVVVLVVLYVFQAYFS